MTTTLGRHALALASMAMLAACGGGGGGSSSPVTPPVTTLTLTGVVSTGPAVASAPVQITCATGTASATTAADGSYSAGITSGALPCVLRATTASGSHLHSVAAGTGQTTSANITPLTELVTANLSGGDPELLYATFDATAQAKVTAPAIATAIAATSAALAGSVDLTGANPLTDSLVVATGTSSGNAADQQVAQLNSAITTKQTTLPAVVGVMPSQTPVSPPVLSTLATQATTCAPLRSGAYRVLNPSESVHSASSEANRITIDAVALTATGSDGTVDQLTAVAGAPCSFTYAADFGTATALVSTGGMIVVRDPSSTGPVRTSFVVPDQTVPLAQLAGTWNFVTYQRNADPTLALTAGNGTLVMDAAGNFTSGTSCVGLTCTSMATADLPPKLAVDANGGFDTNEDPAGPTRLFAVIANNGAKTLFALLPGEEGMTILTQQAALTLPSVGAVTNFWDFTVGSGAFEWAPANNADGGASTLADYSISVTAVDTTAQSYTRLRASDQRVDTFVINNPRNGVRNRAASTNASASIAMPLAGWGVVVSTNVSTSQNFFDVSVDHP